MLTGRPVNVMEKLHIHMNGNLTEQYFSWMNTVREGTTSPVIGILPIKQ
jgi:hypothetical protein